MSEQTVFVQQVVIFLAIDCTIKIPTTAFPSHLAIVPLGLQLESMGMLQNLETLIQQEFGTRIHKFVRSRKVGYRFPSFLERCVEALIGVQLVTIHPVLIRPVLIRPYIGPRYFPISSSGGLAVYLISHIRLFHANNGIIYVFYPYLHHYDTCISCFEQRGLRTVTVVVQF